MLVLVNDPKDAVAGVVGNKVELPNGVFLGPLLFVLLNDKGVFVELTAPKENVVGVAGLFPL